MKNNHIQQQITETLELCLSKMSTKLKNNFDPEDKDSLKLLQHFRSTLSTLRSWIKQSAQTIHEVKETVKNTFSSKNKRHAAENSPKIPYDKKSKEHEKITTPMNQPSGPYCTSAKT